uniref:Uncharacterized protein n=1 Tax=Arundo donax TaxID=35708 RepID=A0A0A9EV00_ARUDO
MTSLSDHDSLPLLKEHSPLQHPCLQTHCPVQKLQRPN